MTDKEGNYPDEVGFYTQMKTTLVTFNIDAAQSIVHMLIRAKVFGFAFSFPIVDPFQSHALYKITIDGEYRINAWKDLNPELASTVMAHYSND